MISEVCVYSTLGPARLQGSRVEWVFAYCTFIRDQQVSLHYEGAMPAGRSVNA